MIFLALVVQFKQRDQAAHRLRGDPVRRGRRARRRCAVMGAPFGFMAFLGVASLIGVIVSHVIVLFDFIEEKHAEGRAAARRRCSTPDPAPAPGAHHGRRDGARPVPARPARRTAVGAALLRADRRADGRDGHHAAAGAGVLLDFVLDLKIVKWEPGKH